MKKNKIVNYSGCKEIDELLNEEENEDKLELQKAYLLSAQGKKEESFLLLKKLADKNIGEACYYLALCYEWGDGTTKDLNKAFACYKKAVDLDFTDALNNLAGCYFLGKGTEEDIEKAYECYTKAANLGDEDAIEFIKKFDDNIKNLN